MLIGQKKLAQDVQDYMLAHNLTLNQLAKRANMSPNTVRKVVQAERMAYLSVLKICQVIGVTDTAQYFVKGGDS